jgi:hypothetical protein
MLRRLDEIHNFTSSVTTVSPEQYHSTVSKARKAIQPLVEQVYTDCRLWILPGTRQKNTNKQQIKFQCDLRNFTKLQDEPCDAITLCLVVTDIRLWKKQTSNTNPFNITLLETTATSRLLTPNIHNPNKSAILTLVDSTTYLQKGTIWESFLNKASYSLRAQRPLFIWIGRIDKGILNEREVTTVETNFGVTCDPQSNDRNAMHYVKPIAFLALFRKQTLLKIPTAFFVDADVYMNTVAYDHESTTSSTLEDYFELSPQASIIGSQNPSGNDDNILFNGGFLGLRNTDEMVDFASLWWYCRCGERGK